MYRHFEARIRELPDPAFLGTVLRGMAPGEPFALKTVRIGNAEDNESERHGADIAPRYPLPLGYRHGGQVWHLSGAGTLRPGLPPGWHLRMPLTPAALARALRDHRIGEYSRKLAVGATQGR